MKREKRGDLTFSFEFFPPKDAAGEERLWATIAELESHAPDFISVTYGAGGSTRERTTRITSEITARTKIPTVAHLTCVGSTREDLGEILSAYQAVGIESILALRGDPEGGPGAAWISTPGGFSHSDQLVHLAAETGNFIIGVAAFPDGHPASRGDFELDIEVLLRKEELGASFATTQFFFDVNRWSALVERLDARGSRLPIIPGILPVTSFKQLLHMSNLSGTLIPEELQEKFEVIENDASAVKSFGVEVATKLCQELLAAGAPGLHFYTMNSSTATQEIYANLGIRK